MSSTIRSVAQIPARIKYLVAVATSSSSSINPIADDCTVFTCSAGALAGSSLIASGTTIPGIATTSYTAGDLFKDLGRQVVVYDATTKLHLAVFREVQPVEGAGAEGVGEFGTTPRFIKVWSATGVGVYVARVGPGAH